MISGLIFISILAVLFIAGTIYIIHDINKHPDLYQ
jgi:hypothetical protein